MEDHTIQFFKDFAFAAKVVMRDKTTNLPRIIGYIVPRDGALNEAQPDLAGARVLLQMDFGADTTKPGLTFYNPDGTIFAQPDEVEHDDIINKPMDLAWTGDEHSGMMKQTAKALLGCATAVVFASEIAEMTGVDPQVALDSLPDQFTGAHSSHREDTVANVPDAPEVG